MIIISPRRKVPEFLYRILALEDWDRLKDTPVLKDENPFVHLSTKDQLERVLKKFWDKKSHVVLKLEASKVVGELKLEPQQNGFDHFFHLYDGYIPTEAVRSAVIRNGC